MSGVKLFLSLCMRTYKFVSFVCQLDSSFIYLLQDKKRIRGGYFPSTEVPLSKPLAFWLVSHPIRNVPVRPVALPV